MGGAVDVELHDHLGRAALVLYVSLIVTDIASIVYISQLIPHILSSCSPVLFTLDLALSQFIPA